MLPNGNLLFKVFVINILHSIVVVLLYELYTSTLLMRWKCWPMEIYFIDEVEMLPNGNLLYKVFLRKILHSIVVVLLHELYTSTKRWKNVAQWKSTL